MDELLRLVLEYELDSVKMTKQQEVDLLISILTEYLKQKDVL